MEHEFYKLISSNPEIGYNEFNKRKFRTLGHKFLKKLQIDCELSGHNQTKLGYNPGGIAVSGDFSLMVMSTKEEGFALYLSEPLGGGNWVMIRSITAMNDHTGGNNVWVPNDKLKTTKTLQQFIEGRFKAHEDRTGQPPRANSKVPREDRSTL